MGMAGRVGAQHFKTVYGVYIRNCLAMGLGNQKGGCRQADVLICCDGVYLS